MAVYSNKSAAHPIKIIWAFFMNIEEYIRKQITEHLNPSHLEVINESHLHVGHAGDDGSGQTHFKLVIEADAFNSMQVVERHRLVNDLLSDCFESGLHALSLKLNKTQDRK